MFSVHLGIFEKKLKAAGSAVIENKKTINGMNAAIIANSFTGTNFVTYNAENPIEVVKHVKKIGFKRFLISLTQESLALSLLFLDHKIQIEHELPLPFLLT